jgi:hypothetical protein
VDITITALNVTGNEQGLNFYDGSPTTAAPITSVTLTGQSGFASPITANGTYDVAGNVDVTVSGLGTNAVTITGLDNITTVNITTSSPMDRLLVTGVDSNEGCDITEFHFSTTSTTPLTEEVGSFINFDDDGPTAAIVLTGASVVMDESIGERPANAAGAADANDTADDNVAGNLFPAGYGTPIGLLSNVDLVNTTTSTGSDNEGATTHVTLSIVGGNGTDSLLLTTDNSQISLFKESGVIVGRVDNPDGTSNVAGTVAFAISINDLGEVTVAQYLSLKQPTSPDNYDESVNLGSLVNAVVTVTDGDGDVATQSIGIGNALQFQDDGPMITAPFDADPDAAGTQTPEHLGNAVGQTASGTFGYDIGQDSHPASFYDATHSDFVDANGDLAGIQITLTGTVDNSQNPGITQAVATLTAETDTSATFNWSFHYDKDPITALVQDGTAGGTLVFDKALDTYTFTLTDAIDGFSFDVLHTNELLAKAPAGNTGHPLIVAEQLTPNGDPNPFFVQFTANSTTQQIGFGFNSTGDGASVGDTTFNNDGATHDMITNLHEDWVSATQSTNGVAGDTIQKGEAMTLRFFTENILSDVNPKALDGGTERLDPTTSASGVVIKFDGIGNSEDLVLVLDLKDANGNEITRAVNVENSDLIKGNANIPFPYNTEFTLDNNDALLIIEQNDYTVAGETYQIQGIQIMQSANGLTGTAINLDGAIGANHGSSTSNLTAWDPTDNDVLKIVDIGFVQQTSGTIDANLDFAFNIADGDVDLLGVQHINVNISI